MIECPRCGFIQPPDRYCASCGLDIQNYKPQKRSFIFAFLRSPLTQATLSFMIVGIFIYFLLHRQTKIIDQPVEFPLQTEARAEPPQPAQPIKVVNHVEPISDEPEYEDIPPVAEDMPPVLQTAIKLPETVDALFFEVSKEILTQLLREGRSVSVLPTLQVFTIENEKLKILQRAKELPGSAPLVPIKDSHFQFIMPSRRAEIGLKLDVGAPVAAVDSSFSTHVTAQLIGFQKGNDAQPLTLRMAETVTTNLDQSILVVGLIPNGISMPSQPADLAKTPFAVLGSPAFQQNLNEVIFILQFH